MLVRLSVGIIYPNGEGAREFSKVIEVPVLPDVFETEGFTLSLRVSETETRYNMQDHVYDMYWEHFVEYFRGGSKEDYNKLVCNRLLEAGWIEFIDNDE